MRVSEAVKSKQIVEQLCASTTLSRKAVEKRLAWLAQRGSHQRKLRNAFALRDRDGYFDPIEVGFLTVEQASDPAYLPALALCSGIAESDAKRIMHSSKGRPRDCVADVFARWPGSLPWFEDTTATSALSPHFSAASVVAQVLDLDEREAKESLRRCPAATLWEIFLADDANVSTAEGAVERLKRRILAVRAVHLPEISVEAMERRMADTHAKFPTGIKLLGWIAAITVPAVITTVITLTWQTTQKPVAGDARPAGHAAHGSHSSRQSGR